MNNVENKQTSNWVVTPIGRGSFGDVFRLEDRVTGVSCAIKRARESVDNISLQREGSILEYLHLGTGENKTRIVSYYGIETTQELYILKLSLAKQSLQQRIYCSFEGISFSFFQRAIRQLLEGLQYLEQKGIVHADIKPANILVTKEDNLELADFGAAFSLNSYSFEEDAFSTLSYIPPEGVLELKEHGYESDVWSLACSIAEIPLRGKAFFSGRAITDKLHEDIEFRGELMLSHQHRLQENYPEDLCVRSSERGKQLLGLAEISNEKDAAWQQNLLAEATVALNQQEALETDLRNNYTVHFSGNDEQLADFIALMKKMLVFDPRERMRATKLLEEPFCQNLV